MVNLNQLRLVNFQTINFPFGLFNWNRLTNGSPANFGQSTSALHLPKWGMLLFQVTFADETPIRRFFSCWFYPLFEEVLPPIRPKTIVEIVVARTLCRKPSFLVRGPYVFGPLICDWFVNGFSTVSLRFGWAGPCWA